MSNLFNDVDLLKMLDSTDADTLADEFTKALNAAITAQKKAKEKAEAAEASKRAKKEDADKLREAFINYIDKHTSMPASLFAELTTDEVIKAIDGSVESFTKVKGMLDDLSSLFPINAKDFKDKKDSRISNKNDNTVNPCFDWDQTILNFLDKYNL